MSLEALRHDYDECLAEVADWAKTHPESIGQITAVYNALQKRPDLAKSSLNDIPEDYKTLFCKLIFLGSFQSVLSCEFEASNES